MGHGPCCYSPPKAALRIPRALVSWICALFGQTISKRPSDYSSGLSGQSVVFCKRRTEAIRPASESALDHLAYIDTIPVRVLEYKCS
jgi:hypothetical protein